MQNPHTWLKDYVENHITIKGYDDSHNMAHFLNVVQYVKDIIDNDYSDSSQIISGLTREESVQLLLDAALCHDVIDSKYVNTVEAIQDLRKLLLSNGYKEEDADILIFLIDNISFSKQRKNSIAIPERLRLAMDILGDADKLDAYRVERVIIYQAQKNKNLTDSQEKDRVYKGWIKTILVKRVLAYKDNWLKTKYAKKIAIPLHQEVENYVNTHLAKYEMFDY